MNVLVWKRGSAPSNPGAPPLPPDQRTRLPGVILWLLSLACMAANAIAQSATSYPLDSFTEFSAVMIGSRVELGEGTQEGHIYRSGNLIRMEDPGKLGYFITDLTTGETHGMSEAGCMHDTHPFIRVFPFNAASKPGATVTRAPAGTEKETVDAHSCQIENVTVSAPTFANPLKMKFWEAEDLQGFPIKVEFLLPGGHDAIVHYKNVVLGPQDPTLFIHPKSCEPLPKPESKPKKPPSSKKPTAEQR
jgi:hypothetical protein